MKTISKGIAVKQALVALLYFDGSDLDEDDRKCKRECMKIRRMEALLQARGQQKDTATGQQAIVPQSSAATLRRPPR
jgi:hypothetical protein